jgi:hypothetical protein
MGGARNSIYCGIAGVGTLRTIINALTEITFFRNLTGLDGRGTCNSFECKTNIQSRILNHMRPETCGSSRGDRIDG